MYYTIFVVLALLSCCRGFAKPPVDDFLPSSAGFFSPIEEIARIQMLNSVFQLADTVTADIPLVDIVYPDGIIGKPPFVILLIQIDGSDLAKEKHEYRLQIKKLIDEEKRVVEVSTIEIDESLALSIYSVWTAVLRSTRYLPPNGSASVLLRALHSCFVLDEGRYEGWVPGETEIGGKVEMMGHVAVDLFLWCESKGSDVKAKARVEKNLAELKRRTGERKGNKGLR